MLSLVPPIYDRINIMTPVSYTDPKLGNQRKLNENLCKQENFYQSISFFPYSDKENKYIKETEYKIWPQIKYNACTQTI